MNNNLSSNYQISSNTNWTSIFKLPAVFTVVMVAIDIFSYLYGYLEYFNYRPLIELGFVFNHINNLVFNWGVFYFFMSTILFIDRRLYQVTLKNLAIILSIDIVYKIIIHFSIEFIRNGALLNSFCPLVMMILDIINKEPFLWPIIEMFFFTAFIYVIGCFEVTKRPIYLVTLSHNNLTLALIFTIIFALPIIMFCQAINYPVLYNAIHLFIRYYIHSIIVEFLLQSIYPLLIFINITICIFVVFYSVKNSFILKMDKIPFKLLFKAVFLSYWYIFLYSIFIAIILFFLDLIIMSQITSFVDRNMGIALIAQGLLIFVLGIINIIIMAKCTRVAVKQYFS